MADRGQLFRAELLKPRAFGLSAEGLALVASFFAEARRIGMTDTHRRGAPRKGRLSLQKVKHADDIDIASRRAREALERHRAQQKVMPQVRAQQAADIDSYSRPARAAPDAHFSNLFITTATAAAANMRIRHHAL